MKMVTYYNTKDLVSFGKYLLSEEREKNLRLTDDENFTMPYEDRFREIHDADLANWKEKISKK